MRRASSANVLRTVCVRPSVITTRTVSALRPQRSEFAAESSKRRPPSAPARGDSAPLTSLPLRTIDAADTAEAGTRKRGITAACPPRVESDPSRIRRVLGRVTVNCDTALTGTLAPRRTASMRRRFTPGRRPPAADSRATSTPPGPAPR